MNEAFFILHSEVPREGPGDAASLHWAMDLAGIKPDARILDAGCGPGADVADLLAVAPQGHVTAVDAHAPFTDRVAQAWAGDARVTVLAGDMAAQSGPFDIIWCAGAMYFLGITNGLKSFRDALSYGGAIVFSELVTLVDAPSPEVAALKSDYADFAGIDVMKDRIEAAGYDLLGLQVLSDTAWEDYFQPLESRIATLRPGADAALNAVLDEQAAEIALWRAHRDEFGYALAVVRPR